MSSFEHGTNFENPFPAGKVKESSKPTITKSSKGNSFAEGYSVHTIKPQKSPKTELPSDEEKNVGVINRKGKVPIYKQEVYLTFDDGPSRENTMRILDILNKSGVKASFFVVGSAAERNVRIIHKLNESGMCILPHSYSHKYTIYRSKAAYLEDLNKNIAVIERLIGRRIAPFLRMPGGSANTPAKGGMVPAIKSAIKKKGLKYVDWNVNSFDANKLTVDSCKIKANVINICRNLKFAVVLMHDGPTKTTTVQALPEIIRYLKGSGFVFRTFQDITPEEEKELIKRRVINR